MSFEASALSVEPLPDVLKPGEQNLALGGGNRRWVRACAAPLPTTGSVHRGLACILDLILQLELVGLELREVLLRKRIGATKLGRLFCF